MYFAQLLVLPIEALKHPNRFLSHCAASIDLLEKHDLPESIPKAEVEGGSLIN